MLFCFWGYVKKDSCVDKIYHFVRTLLLYLSAPLSSAKIQILSDCFSSIFGFTFFFFVNFVYPLEKTEILTFEVKG